jgi:hypothetical protein
VSFDLQTLVSIHGHNPLCNFWSADTILCLRTWSSLWLLSRRYYFPSADTILSVTLIGGQYFPSVDTILSVTFERRTLFSICRHDPLCDFWSFDLKTLFSICGHDPLSDFWLVDTFFCLQTWSSPKFWVADIIFHLRTRSSEWLLIGWHYFCLRTWSSLWIWSAGTIFHLQTRSSQWSTGTIFHLQTQSSL